MKHDLAVVTGAGGFIGGHLVKRLIEEGQRVRAVDRKPFAEWWQLHDDASNLELCDLSHPDAADVAAQDADEIFHLAADMGGMGFITQNKLDCMLSVLPSTNMLVSGARYADRFFYASSACVYPDYRQDEEFSFPLAETDAYPAMPEDGYGWEKLFTERMCSHFSADRDLPTRVARYHNVYGPNGTWQGGREKAPAALCRKIAEADINGDDSIEIWGDGRATRTFMHVDDCVEGTLRIARGDYSAPVNLGSDHDVSITELAQLIMHIGGVEKDITYVDGPQGVRGRASDNTLISNTYHWAPSISLLEGLTETYSWVWDQVKETMDA